MKIFRFMSNEEFEKYKNGETLENHKNHAEMTNGKSNSVGFCFFDIDDYKPEKAMHFVSGIVSFDICAIFEVNEKFLKKAHGQYAEPIIETGNYVFDLFNFIDRFDEKFMADEYCSETYNNKDFKLIKYSKNIWEQHNNVGEQKELEWIENE